MKNKIFLFQEPSTLRSPREFCERHTVPHSVIDQNNPIDTNKPLEVEDPSERPITSSSDTGRTMFVNSIDLNKNYDGDE